jgi:low temperature requirement protein LtrA
VSYAIVRFIHLGLYVDASRKGNAAWGAIVGFAAAATSGMLLLIVGSLFEGELRTLLWLAAIAIDYAGPAWLTRERLVGLQAVAIAHFAERYGLFIIICLGESVIAIGVGASGRDLDFGLIAAVALSLLIVVGLWWTYFDRAAEDAEERLRGLDEPVLAAADAYSYIHLLLVAGIVLFAVGAKSAIAHVEEPLETGAQLALFAGVALYLAGHAAFRLRISGRMERVKLLAVVAVAAECAITRELAAWWALLAVAGALVALVAREALTAEA